MPDRDKAHLPAAPGLGLDALYARNAADLVTDQELAAKFDAAPGKHASRQRHRRQQAALGRMAVDGKPGLAFGGREQQDIPAAGQHVAALVLNGRQVEQGGHAAHRRQRNLVLGLFRASYPSLQRTYIHPVKRAF